MEEERPRSNVFPPAEDDSSGEEDPTPKKSDEESLYKNIPLQGTHRGEVDDPLTSSVRAPSPAEPTAPAKKVEEEPKEKRAPDADE